MTCFGHWRHEPTGAEISHCGHPTAIWPYLATAADGRDYVAPNGRGFRTLAIAMEAVEAGLERSALRVIFDRAGHPHVVPR